MEGIGIIRYFSTIVMFEAIANLESTISKVRELQYSIFQTSPDTCQD
jgi:hypothetical protein